MRGFKLHLTTLCGCTKTVSNGSTPPPRTHTVALERSRRKPVPQVVALSLASVTPHVGEDITDELRNNGERRFELVSYSGTEEFGTGFYVEV